MERRQWLSDASYGELVGLCQFLPGPSSSQVGFGLGLLRAGPLGGIAAWTAFTLPSALLMLLFAGFEQRLSGPIGNGILHGLKLVAIPVVVHAIVAMARTLTPDLRRIAIAGLTALLIALLPFAWTQIAAIVVGAICGIFLCQAEGGKRVGLTGWLPGYRIAIVCLVTFTLLLIASLPASLQHGSGLAALSASFYRAGALVFGGGHVVLPLLRASMVPHWIDPQSFLAGYGAAQAVPGPLFTFATFLGYWIAGWPGTILGTIAISLPGLLLVAGILPVERQVRSRPVLQKALAGINAAVVGILVAALCTALLPTAILAPTDAMIAVGGPWRSARNSAPAVIAIMSRKPASAPIR